MEFCHKIIPTRSQCTDVAGHGCHRLKGYLEKCEKLSFLNHLKSINKQIVEEIKRDATMTTGVAWKSAGAGPNQILRWAMFLGDEGLLKYGINMAGLELGVITRLYEKAIDCDSRTLVAAKSVWLVYQMENAPKTPAIIKEYLEDIFGTMVSDTTRCVIYRLLLDYELLSMAVRGKVVIETYHKNPRMHNPENVGLSHHGRDIAQSAKTLDEFYQWIEAILTRVEEEKSL